jgi:class 3 adenylate cyclase
MGVVARAAHRTGEAIRRFEAYDPFGLGSRDTYGAGARLLLERAEVGVERALHLMRLVLATALTFALLSGLEMISLWYLVPALCLAALLWWLYWRRLARGAPTLLQKCLLIGFDMGAAIKAAVWINLPQVVSYFAVVGLDREDVILSTPVILAFLSFSGGLRLDPRVAVITTVAATGCFLYFAVTMELTLWQGAVVGGIVLAAGLMGTYMAVVLRQIALRASEQQVLMRYVPENLARDLQEHGDLSRAARTEQVAVLFADVRGFTRRAAGMAPARVVEWLNVYFSAVIEPVRAEDGVIDKYLGDGVLIFFEGQDGCARAVRAALGMLEAARRLPGMVRVGIAVHAGEALIGAVGAPERREYTIIGDVVNVGARLEECNKQLESVLVMSAEVYRQAGGAAPALVGPLSLPLRGHDAVVEVYWLPDPAPARP